MAIKIKKQSLADESTPQSVQDKLDSIIDDVNEKIKNQPLWVRLAIKLVLPFLQELITYIVVRLEAPEADLL